MILAVVGVGLVGGSVALAARERLGATVLGVDPDPAAAAVLDRRVGLDALADAELVVVAAPLGALGESVEAALGAVGDVPVTDVGSAKAPLVARCTDRRFVGGHPLAGGEQSGAAHARADLFDGATWYLTPTATTEGLHLERVHRFVSGLGARPAVVDAADHDRHMAAVSHLPHVLANVLVEGARGAPAAGPSLRDAARVAGANPSLWADIYLANRDALLAAVDAAQEGLAGARALLEAGDREGLRAWQERAGEARRTLLEAVATGGPLEELRATVPNRPGVVADLALALARAGVNISDMALSPSPDGTRGAIRLWVAADRADDARGVLTGLDLPLG